MNTWVRKHDVLFNFINKKIKFDNENFNLISYKIAGVSDEHTSIRVIYNDSTIPKDVIFSKIIIYLTEYDKFVRKTKIETLSKI